MHQQKGKKIVVYFFLLLIFSSVHNISLEKLKFYKIININIFGLNMVNNQIIKNNIKNLNLDNIFLIDEHEIRKVIDTNSLIEKYEIFKNYPSTLNIKILKTEFLARINIDGKIFLVGSNGKLIKDNLDNKSLPFIFGKASINEFLNFKKILDQSKFSYDEIENFFFFPSKRWDLELKNKTIIKLSRENPKSSLNKAFEFFNDKNFKNIKLIDARINNNIIINAPRN